MDDTGGPVHHEDLPAGKLLGLLQHRHGVVHVANAVQQRDRRGVLSAQQSDGGQVQRFLKVGKARSEFPQARGEKLHAFARDVGVSVLGHQQEEQLRILRRSHAVYGHQVLEFRAMRNGGRADCVVHCGHLAVESNQGRTQQQGSKQVDDGFHERLLLWFSLLPNIRCIYIYLVTKTLKPAKPPRLFATLPVSYPSTRRSQALSSACLAPRPSRVRPPPAAAGQPE